MPQTRLDGQRDSRSVRLPSRRMTRKQVHTIVSKNPAEHHSKYARRVRRDKDDVEYVQECVSVRVVECRRFEEAKWLERHHHDQFAKVEEEKERKSELLEWFNFMDVDGSGEISYEELEDPLLSLGFASNTNEVRALIDSVDIDGSGEIGFEEFYSLVTRSADKPGEVNPIVALYQALKEGKLGDKSLSLPSLITTYRRQVMLTGLTAYANGKSDHGTGGVNMAALEQLFAAKAAREMSLSQSN